MQQKYPKEITDRAASLGFKASNLHYLDTHLQSHHGIGVSVPAFSGIPHDVVIKHLDQHAPSWRAGWEDFKKTYDEQKDKTVIGEKAENILHKLQSSILTAFAEHPLSDPSIKEFLDNRAKEELLMVRSTGKEDSTELANPGGNESVACVTPDAASVSAAIGEVVASYMSVKSLSQRIKAKDDITKDPFCPVLLQTMIGRDIPKDPKDSVRSGVIFSGAGTSRIQAAPGHGELVVNSKGNADKLLCYRSERRLCRRTHEAYTACPW